MKTLFTAMFLLIVSSFVSGQNVLLFSENFESNSSPDSMTYVGTGAWGTSSYLASQGTKSDSLRIVNAGDIVQMKTYSFSTVGYPYAILKFDQICKIEFFDYAYIEVSGDNGSTWNRLTGTQYMGNGLFSNFGDRFNSASYPSSWNPSTYFVPENTWWKSETFDLSTFVGNSANVLVRFVLQDANWSGQQSDNYAWFIDNIKVMGSLYEFYPPTISMIPPIQQDTITSNTAYLIKAKITDNSGIDTAYVAYTVNSYIVDTIPMVKMTGDTFQAFIPFYGYGRTIHYKIVARDMSLAINYANYPPTGNLKIYAKYSTAFTYILGTGATFSELQGPMYSTSSGGSPYSAYAYMYRASELAAAGIPTNGLIKKIEWYKVNGSTTNGNASFKIFLKNSSQVIWPTGYATLPLDTITNGSTQVYNSTTQQFNSTVGWYPFNVSPFQYTGSDLEVSAFWNNSMVSYPQTNGVIMWAYTSGFAETKTMGNGASDPPSIVASFWYGGPMRPNVRFTVELPYNLNVDAGISSIINPTTSVTAGSSFNVVTKVKNYGMNSLSSVQVKWSVDGVAQTPFSYTGPLAHDSISNQITLGSLSLPVGVHRIKIWTDNPNAVSDMDIANDTAYITFMACTGLMSGTYTVGASSSDFTSVGDAVLALSQCGISGSVTMNINPGVYNEQIVIPAILGASATNTITFKSSNNDSSSVLIRNVSSSSNNYVVCLDGAKNIHFKYLSIKALDSTYGKVILFKNHSSNLSIQNCELFGINTNLNTNEQSIIVANAGAIDSAFLIKNTRFNDGFNALVLSGYSADTLINNVKINNNIFINQYLLSANLSALNALEFTHNIIKSTNNSLAPQGVNLVTLKNKWKFTHNTISLLSGPRAISIWNCNSSYGNEALFANNMISQGGTYMTNMIDLNNGTAIKFYNNTFLKYANTSGNTFYINTNPITERTDSLYFLNNIFVNNGGYGKLVNLAVPIGTRKIQFNYNDYFTNSTDFGTNGTNAVTSFAAWKTATAQDANSKNVDPIFASNNNLHITNYALKGQGIQNSDVQDDIDSKPRTNYPTIGAHELFDLTSDINVVALLSPSTGCGLGSTETVKVRIINNGINPINTPFTLSFSKNGFGIVTETINQTMAVGDTLDYTFTGKINLSLGASILDSVFKIKVWCNYSLDQFVFNDTVSANIVSGFKPSVPTVGSFNTVYGTSATLSATSTYVLFWYATDTSTTTLAAGPSYVTPILFDTTTFYVAAKNLSGLMCESSKVPIVVNVTNFPQFDAGLLSITNPTTNVTSYTTTPLKVKLKNYGLQNLTSVKIKYSFNGIIQDSIVWTGNLAHGNSEIVTIDTVSLAGGLYSMKAWTYLPNANTDANSSNDSTNFTFRACMSGTYTLGKIGGTQTYNFNTFSSVVASLVGGGVCGNVTVLVDTGTYNEKLTFNTIPGVGPNATVTFTSMTGDSSSVKIAYPLAFGDSSLIIMRSASYVQFKKLGFYLLNTSGSFSRVFQFESNSNYNTIENCIIQGISTTQTSMDYACIAAFNHVNNYNTFSNNRIKYGSNGFYYYSLNASHSTGTCIKNNIITDYGWAGILIGNHDSLQIIGNKITQNTSATNSQGIACYNVNNGLNISNNTINNTSATNSTGMQIQNIVGSANAKSMVYNNFVTTSSGSSVSNGMSISNCSNVDFYYNSINMIGTGIYGRGVTFTACTNLIFRNNIIKNTAAHVLYFSGTTSTFISSDYNCYHTSGAAFAYTTSNILTFADYQTVSGRDQHSMNVIPPFVSNIDLHMQNSMLSGKAISIPSVTTDIDNQNRTMYPTIGADEYPLSNKDAAVISIVNPSNTTNEQTTIIPKVVIKNQGIDTIFSLPIFYTINNGTPVNYTYNGVLPLFATDTVNLPSYMSLVGNYNFCVNTQLSGDTNVFNNQICKVVYGIPAFDANLKSIVPIQQGCGLSTDSLKLLIKNNGVSTINGNLTASYQIKGSSTIVNQAVTASIASNDSIIFKFSTPINFAISSADSLFEVKTWLHLTNDNVLSNDTITFKIKSLIAPPSPVPTHVSIPYYSQTSVQVSTVPNTQVLWYNNPVGGNSIHQNIVYNTPIMLLSDTLWVESKGNMTVKDSIFLGTGTNKNTATSWPTPYGNYAWGNKEQYLITAAELKAMGAEAGFINRLSFNVDTVNACPTLYDYQIKMAHTTASSMTGWIPGVLTSVFSVGTYQPYKGWNKHDFQTPFQWDGVSNIVVEVCFNNANFVSNGNASVFYSSTPMNTVARYSGDYSTVCYAPGSYSLGAMRPNMKLQFSFDGCSSARVPLYITVGTQPTTDVGVVRIIKPVSNTNLTALDTIKIMVRNFGTQAKTNIPVHIKVDNLPTINETITNTINSGDSLLYTFTAKLNLSTPGKTFKLSAYTTLTGDTTTINDTTKTTATHLFSGYCISSAADPAFVDITNVSVHTLNNTSNPIGRKYTDFSALVAAPSLALGASYPISITSGIPPGGAASTACWVKAWIDFNGDKSFDTTELIFSSATNSAYQVNGSFVVPTSVVSGYTLMRVVLVRYGTASTVQACGTYNNGETEDYIVNILSQGSCDAGITSILQPNSSAIQGTSQPVWLKFYNFGTDTIQPNTLSLAYKLNNGIAVTSNYTGSLPPLKYDSIQMNSITIPQGNNTFCAYTILSCDSMSNNNQICKQVFGETIQSLSYSDNFDSVNNFYTNNSAFWQKGIPTGTIINSPHSIPNVWMTVLNGNYPNNASDYLYSPYFDFSLLSASDTAELSFWHALNSESGFDGGAFQYSLNNGVSWAYLGYMGDPSSQNWYNSNIGGLHSWTGNIPWTQASYKLDPAIFNQANLVKFRFKFFSNGSNNNYDGWAIDNFKITANLPPIDAGVTSILTPSSSVILSDSITVKARIKNFGSDTLVNVPLTYSVNGVIKSSETWTGSLFPGLDTIYTFNQRFKVLPTDNRLCVFTTKAGDVIIMNDTNCINLTVNPAAIDAGIIQIIAPVGVASTIYQNTVKVKIKNFGSTTLTSIPVSYKRGSTVIANETYTGSLTPGATDDYTFNTGFMSLAGNYQLCAKTNLVNDAFINNDETCTTLLGSGIEQSDNNEFYIQQNIPNPTDGKTTIRFFVPLNDELKITITNLLGQTIFTENISATSGENVYEMDLTSLSSGVYYYSIEYKNMKRVKKLVLSK